MTPVEYLTPADYLEKRLEDQINWLEGKSAYNQKSYTRLTLAQIGAASLIPVLVGLGAAEWTRIVIALLGAGIAVSAGIVSLLRFQPKWLEYRATCESLKRERYTFLTRAHPYDGADAFAQLVARVEGHLANENTNWAQYMATPFGPSKPQG
ncbi:MAG TPA: DUF4231 domain-containing protein [Gemmatimonadaceae bacterium]|nr:DUF4231 domain-containing protein [Gemmatimonadaceae bacterium]